MTLVGGGDATRAETERDQASVIPKGAQWLKDAAKSFDPRSNTVHTESGASHTYDYLVLAPGIQLNWNKIPGLKGQVGRNGLCSNYSFETVDSTWESIKSFRGGNAIFTHPATPIKCGGAPQKIMYLAAEYWKKNPPAGDYRIIFCIASPNIFGVKRYADTLLKVVDRHGIEVRFQTDLASIDCESKMATFKNVATGESVDLPWGMMHVTPPMSAPDFIKASPFVNEGGWIDVDKHSLQHPNFSNVFALGDASSLPTSKTGAAIRKQAPALVTSLLAVIAGKPPVKSYDGYTSCPLVTGYGKLVLAEFDYDGNSKESFPFDQSKERKSMYLLKKYLLPRLYWDGMLKGRA